MLTTQKTDDVLEQVQREARWVFHSKDTCTHFIGSCSTCGERRKVLCHVVDMSTECEVCFAKRRYAEITKQIEEAKRVKLDVADFAKI